MAMAKIGKIGSRSHLTPAARKTGSHCTFPSIHYAIFVAQRANITATRLAGLVEEQFCPALKARPRLSLNTTALRPCRPSELHS
ncbi:hypothetical protein CN155_10560 [Sinorhizobium meliloti]|nr:hypothetical protein CN155_10560 [Sinorhizobium meliloti]